MAKTDTTFALPSSASEALQAPPTRTLADRVLAILWRLNFAVVLLAFVWVFVDPLAPRIFGGVEGHFIPGANAADADLNARPWRTVGLVMSIGFAVFSAVFLFVGLFRGPARHRTTRSWLRLTSLAALWLGLLVSWREIAWAGDRWRVGLQLESFERVAAGLRAAGPIGYGKFPELGQFAAYSNEENTTLLMESLDTPPGRAPVVSLERSKRGALRFQLGGDYTGDWLEWHPLGSRPESFTDGLDARHELQRASQIADEWFLVRYR